VSRSARPDVCDAQPLRHSITSGVILGRKSLKP
jgi:hypothetical protein